MEWWRQAKKGKLSPISAGVDDHYLRVCEGQLERVHLLQLERMFTFNALQACLSYKYLILVQLVRVSLILWLNAGCNSLIDRILDVSIVSAHSPPLVILYCMYYSHH